MSTTVKADDLNPAIVNLTYIVVRLIVLDDIAHLQLCHRHQEDELVDGIIVDHKLHAVVMPMIGILPNAHAEILQAIYNDSGGDGDIDVQDRLANVLDIVVAEHIAMCSISKKKARKKSMKKNFEGIYRLQYLGMCIWQNTNHRHDIIVEVFVYICTVFQLVRPYILLIILKCTVKPVCKIETHLAAIIVKDEDGEESAIIINKEDTAGINNLIDLL